MDIPTILFIANGFLVTWLILFYKERLSGVNAYIMLYYLYISLASIPVWVCYEILKLKYGGML